MSERARPGSWWRYDPCLLDLSDPPFGARQGFLLPGDRVRVVSVPGCPRPAGHSFVEAADGRFAGMVQMKSLKPLEEHR